jgi:hypothetical protein
MLILVIASRLEEVFLVVFGDEALQGREKEGGNMSSDLRMLYS